MGQTGQSERLGVGGGAGSRHVRIFDHVEHAVIESHCTDGLGEGDAYRRGVGVGERAAVGGDGIATAQTIHSPLDIGVGA